MSLSTRKVACFKFQSITHRFQPVKHVFLSNEFTVRFQNARCNVWFREPYCNVCYTSMLFRLFQVVCRFWMERKFNFRLSFVWSDFISTRSPIEYFHCSHVDCNLHHSVVTYRFSRSKNSNSPLAQSIWMIGNRRLLNEVLAHKGCLLKH